MRGGRALLHLEDLAFKLVTRAELHERSHSLAAGSRRMSVNFILTSPQRGEGV